MTESLEEQIAKAKEAAQGREPQAWDDAEWWDQNPGTEPIAGRVVEIGSGEFKHGTAPVVVLERADGSFVKFAALRKALAGKLEDAGVKVGDVLSVEYLGQRHSDSSGFDYHAYAVGHVRNAETAEEPF